MSVNKELKEVELYTDGSCLQNPGPGGWAAILRYGEHERTISGGDEFTTNNRMELTGVIEGLKLLKYECKVIVTTDSQYVVNAFNKGWVYNWEKQKFKDRLNADLWKELLVLVRRHEVEFRWIKGHAGHKFNEACDKEAVRQSRKYSKGD